MEFSEILRDYLTNNNLSQKEFADKIGIKQSQVSEWLHGKAKPGYDMLRKISLAHNISPEYLLGLKK